MITRALLVWFVLLLVAVLNGMFREIVMLPRLGPGAAHVVSTLMLCAGILAVAFVAVPWIRPGRTPVGILWLTLTLAFEFGFGRYQGRSWPELSADYDILGGRIWILVLLVTLTAPSLVSRVRKRHGSVSVA